MFINSQQVKCILFVTWYKNIPYSCSNGFLDYKFEGPTSICQVKWNPLPFTNKCASIVSANLWWLLCYVGYLWWALQKGKTKPNIVMIARWL